MYELLSKIPLEIALRVCIVGGPREPPVVNETSASSAAYTGIKGDLRHFPGRKIASLLASGGTPLFDSLHRGGAWFAKVLS